MPSITYVVSLLSQYMYDPRTEHLEAVYRILRYLKWAPDKVILFTKNIRLALEAYTNADWVKEDRRFTSGIVYC